QARRRGPPGGRLLAIYRLEGPEGEGGTVMHPSQQLRVAQAKAKRGRFDETKPRLVADVDAVLKRADLTMGEKVALVVIARKAEALQKRKVDLGDAEIHAACGASEETMYRFRKRLKELGVAVKSGRRGL